MKKAKIMLSVIAVLAVVGGALAFKAKNYSLGNVYCKNANVTTVCTQATYFTTTPNAINTTSQPCAFGGSWYTTRDEEDGNRCLDLSTSDDVYQNIAQ